MKELTTNPSSRTKMIQVSHHKKLRGAGREGKDSEPPDLGSIYKRILIS
jgi:hypothetical protein